MKFEHFNLILLLVAVVLGLNLFFPLKSLINNFDEDKLECEINGNVITDLGLCCSEMAKFSKCSEGVCDGSNYDILSNQDTLRYCENEGYNVRF